MVSFSCEGCNETMIKKKVGPHLSRCRAPVTCIDCSKTFPGQSFKEHNQCMTEDQKYQGKLYKPKAAAKPAAKKEAPKAVPEEKSAPAPEKAIAKSQKPSHVKIEKKSSLKKVLKKLRKDLKVDKKEILARLTVDTDGRLLLV